VQIRPSRSAYENA
jgi:hypothetical protein